MNQTMGQERSRSAWARLLPALILFCLLPQTVAAKPLLQTYDVTQQCFGVADERTNTQDKNLSDKKDTLVRINRSNGQSSVIGLTGTEDIEAIAFDASETLYAANGSQLGILDLETGQFTAKPQPFGKVSGINLNNVDGLFYDTFTQTLYGVQRRGSSKPDILFQINPATGTHIPTAFGGKGYVEITNVRDSQKNELDDVDDIAVDPNNGAMYAAMNQGGTGGILARVNTNTGQTTVLGEVKYVTGPLVGTVVDDIEGLSFFNDGQLYGSTGDNGPSDDDKNKLFRLEVPAQPGSVVTATLVGSFPANTSDPTHFTPVDFEALACLTASAFINLRKFTHAPGQALLDADQPPGPQIPAGSPVIWTYVMTNTGILTLTNISLSDDKVGPINLVGNCQPLNLILGPGESMTCTATGSAQAGPYVNRATVIAKTQEGVIFPRRTVSDVNLSHYFGTPGITVKKFVNGVDADIPPGPQIPVGQPVNWRYVVKNVSLVPLINIVLFDDKLGTIPCPQSQLSSGEAMACPMAGVAVRGLQRNIATVSAAPASGTGGLVTNSDQAHYTGIDPQSAGIIGTLWFDQNRNGEQPEPHETRLVNVAIHLSNSSGAVLTNTVTNPDGAYSFSGLAAGAYTVQVVTATLPGDVVPTYDVAQPFDHQAQVTLNAGETRSDINFGYCQRCASIAGQVWSDDDGGGTRNGPEAGLLQVGLGLWVNGSWLTRTTLADGAYHFPNLAAGLYTVQVEVATLPPRARPTVDPEAPPDHRATILVAAGQNHPNADFGYQPAPPEIALKKLTNQQDADLPPGPSVVIGDPVIWSYVVTNTGGTMLQQLTITDDNGTANNSQDDFVVCEIPQLAPTAATTCTAGRNAITGQYVNLGKVTAHVPNSLATVQAQDSSHYFGTLRLIALKKFTNAADADTLPGPLLSKGAAVTWSYFITNTGTVSLRNIRVTDDNGTPTDLADDFSVCTLPELLAGQSFACSASGVAQLGQYRNWAIASGEPVDGSPVVNASDLSHYLGVPLPFELELETYTNDQKADLPTGPEINEFDPVTWSYRVTNTGTRGLKAIQIVDDNGTPTDANDDHTVCTLDALLPNQTFTCQATGVAQQGQYRNLGTATGQAEDDSQAVSASDPSHYLGIRPPFDIDIKTYTNGVDADTPPGPEIKVSSPVNWSYLVTNTGTSTLTNIRVTDDSGTPQEFSDDLTPCIIPTLAAGQSSTCSATGVAKLGPYKNIGTATVQPSDGSPVISASAASHYLGTLIDDPSPGQIDLEKFTNEQDVTAPPGPRVVISNTVTWRYTVANRGQAPIRDINVTDDNGTPDQLTDDFQVCLIPELAPSQSTACTATGRARLGQYRNIGTATGQVLAGNGLSSAQTVRDSDASYYLGVISPITTTPQVNGIAVGQAPGVCVQAPGLVRWSYVVSNIGDLPITNIQLTDEQLGEIRCPDSTLGKQQSMICSAGASAVVGPVSSTVRVNGQLVSSDGSPSGQAVEAKTPAYYFGRHTAMTVEKLVNGAEADFFNDKWIPLPATANFTYWITNTGNTPLTNLTVADSDPTLTVSCPKSELAPGESLQCIASAPAQVGDYFHEGIVTAQPVDEQGVACGVPLRLTDPVYYYGFRSNELTLTLEPGTATRDVGTLQTVTATVRDRALDQPLVDKPIHFVVSGLNPTHHIVNTNELGQARFSYAGAVNLATTDTISAWLEVNNNQTLELVGPTAEPFARATVAWNAIAVGICHDSGGTVVDPMRQLTVKAVRLPPSGKLVETPTGNCDRPALPVMGVRIGVLVTNGTAYGPHFATIADQGVVTFAYTSTAPKPAVAQATAVTTAAVAQPDQPQADTDLVTVWGDLNNNGRYDNGEPFDLSEVTTAVQLVGFTAHGTSDRVLLRWTTAVEIDHAGFNLYRARTVDGEYSPINSQFIGAQGEGYGASYEFVDVPPEPGPYYYKLEAVSNANVRNSYPPQVAWFAIQPPSDPASHVYLPVVQR